MKNFISALLTVLVISGIFIGCDFIDNNSPTVELGDTRDISVRFDYHADTDTSGWDGP